MDSKEYIYMDYYGNSGKEGQRRLWFSDRFKVSVGDFVRCKSSFKEQTDWFGIVICFIHLYDGEMGIIAKWSMDRGEALSVSHQIDFDKYVMGGYNLIDKRWKIEKDFNWDKGALPSFGHMSLNKEVTKEELKMHNSIIEAFPKTKDAVLVDKWFGKQFEQNALIALLVKGKEKTLLAEALMLEEKSLNKS